MKTGRDHRERGFEGTALRELGHIVAAGEELYRHALAIADELGLRPLQVHCHLGLGKLYGRAGPRDEARAELATAVGMLREIGMAHWLPEAERELAEAGSAVISHSA